MAKKMYFNSKLPLNSNVKLPEYTPDELKYLEGIIQDLQDASDQRNQPHKLFDGMTYEEYYNSNRDAAESYIAPKINKDDTNIVGGTTKKKCETLESVFLGFNYEPDIMSFDKDNNLVVELGENMEDIVKKTREQEIDKNKKRLRWKEMIVQGDVFVEEYFKEVYKNKKKITSKFNGKINSCKWTERLEKALGKCESRIIPGLNFYPGNIYNHFMEEQPFIATVDTIPYDKAKAIYGKWERWENVESMYRAFLDDTEFRDAVGNTLTVLGEGQKNLEILKIQRQFSNEFMILLNGVMMLPIGYPLTEVSPSGAYSITKGSMFPMSQNFFYSSSIPKDTKVTQQVSDEFLRLFVKKTQYSTNPSLANNTGRQVNKSIFRSGTIHDRLDTTKLSPILPTDGVTAPEFEFYKLLKSVIDENSFSQVIQGLGLGKEGTATESLQAQRQSMNMIGIPLLGVICLEQEMVWKRIFNIIKNYTSNYTEDVSEFKKGLGRRLTIDTNIENGRKGLKIIEFNKEKSQQPSENTYVEENAMEEVMGQPVRITYLDPDKYVEALENDWVVKIVPTPENTTELQQIMFQKLISNIGAIAPERLNKDYALERMIILGKEDPDKLLLKQAPIMPEAIPGGLPNGGLPGNESAGAINKLMGQIKPKEPSINTMQNQV